MSSADAANQWILAGQTTRDSRGRVTNSFVPTYFTYSTSSGGPPPLVAGGGFFQGVGYDAFNRPTQSTDIDGTVTSQSTYHALSIDSYDATTRAGGAHAGAYVTTTADGHGRTVSAAKRGNGGVVTTQVTYAPTGEVAQVSRTGQDAQGAVNYTRYMIYDSLGRMVQNFEPNAIQPATAGSANRLGTAWWTYVYNDLGDLVATSDPRGCGENIAYDGAGRVQSEDYSPCDATAQQPWSQPSSAAGDGDGTEAYYVYEGTALQTGRLSDVYDRASHIHATHDLRGRTTQVSRQIANPGIPSNSLASRYSPTVFTVQTGYDDRDRVATQTTGADISQLQSSSGGTTVSATYSTRGNIATVGGSYGLLIASSAFEADGRPDSVTYGDAAQTTIAFSYVDPRQRLSQLKVWRAGPFPSATSTYTPPVANPAEPTQQTILANDCVASYDAASNPLITTDQRLVGEWPAGAKPVATRTYVYDDSYRVTGVTSTYNGGSDAYMPPIAPSTPSTSPVPMALTPNRVLKQTWTYDGLGNTRSSTDDANVFYDRSLGTITNGNATNGMGPNQLVSASLQSTTGVPGSLAASYDYAGNLAELSVTRSGSCSASEPCSQRYIYGWDEVGRLASATRYDYTPPPPCTGRICPFITGTYAVAASVLYAYDAADSRVLRSATEASGATTYSAEIFPSLRLDHANWNSTTSAYEETVDTEAVYLALGGAVYGRVVYDPQAPAIKGPQHVFLEITDQLYSTAIVVDRDTSELVERTTYLAYGALDSDYRPDRWQNFREDYKFTGKEDDVEVGITYFGERYYSPQLGRWISPDPLAIHALGGDPNPYAYVGGHVTVATDPMGLSEDDDFGEGEFEDLQGSTYDTGDAEGESATFAPNATSYSISDGQPTWTIPGGTVAGVPLTMTLTPLPDAYNEYGLESAGGSALANNLWAGLLLGFQASTNPVLSTTLGAGASLGPSSPASVGVGIGLMAGGTVQSLGGTGAQSFGGAAIAGAGAEEVATAGLGTVPAAAQAVGGAAAIAEGEVLVGRGLVAASAGFTILMAQAAKGGNAGSTADQGPRRFSSQQRAQGLEEASGEDGVPRCEHCRTELTTEPGQPNTYEADHRQPYSRGGPTTDENLDPTCRTCNRSKGARTVDEWGGP